MKLVMGCCATLLAFVLIAPAAHAGWPPSRPPRDTTPPTVPTGLRVVSATEDSLTLRWNASTDNSGSIHHYVVSPAPGTRATARRRRSPASCPTDTQTYRVSRGRRDRQRVGAERPADGDDGARRDRRPRRPATCG